jgi:sorbitol/mannitol transport system substrate-binding protein
MSTYQNPDYLKVARSFAGPTLTAIQTANPISPGVQPRPTIGIQFVDIPEFTDFGTASSLAIGSAIAGKESVHSALETSQRLAANAGKLYQK